MSLHAYLHPEAQEAFDLQQRRARATSIIIAILGTTLLALIMGLLALKAYVEPAGSPFYISDDTLPPDEPPPPTTKLFTRPTPAPAGAPNPVIVSINTSPLAVPVPDIVNPIETEAFGSGDTEGIGDGDLFGQGGPQGPYISIPPTQRCSKSERLARLSETGGSAAVDDAVVETLRWLKATQDRSGSWGQQHKAGMTGFALLAYLGHCETPVSVEFGDSCTDAIVYLLDLGMKNNGKLSTNLGDKHWPY